MPWYIYTGFVLAIAFLIYIDLSVLHKKSKEITVKSALFWTGVWVCIALLFNVVVYYLYENDFVNSNDPSMHMSGWSAVVQFLTGYLLEYMLSLDNIFVIAMIIAAFRVPSEHQHRLLFWGILGAALLRGVMIWIGAELIHRFEWTIYVFGGLLILSAIKMLMTGDEEIDPNSNFVVRMIRKVIPVSNEFHGKNFLTKIDGKTYATPMLLALLLIESCDVMFAVDSIPAIFGVTKDPFLVFTSNIFAILGLRSLYFALAGMMGKFEYLKYALILLLLFVGVKMLLSHTAYKIPNEAALGVVVATLVLGVLASLLKPASAEPNSDVDEPPRL